MSDEMWVSQEPEARKAREDKWDDADYGWNRRAYETKTIGKDYADEQLDATGFRGGVDKWNKFSSTGKDFRGVRTRYLDPAAQSAMTLGAVDHVDAETGQTEKRLALPDGSLADSTKTTNQGMTTGSLAQRHIFAMTPTGDIRAADGWANRVEEGEGKNKTLALLNHSSLSAMPHHLRDVDPAYADALVAGKVAGAGELELEQGRLKEISDRSGHFKPSNKMTSQVVERFDDMGIDLNDTTVRLTEAGDQLRQDLPESSGPVKRDMLVSARELQNASKRLAKGIATGDLTEADTESGLMKADRAGLAYDLGKAVNARNARLGDGQMQMRSNGGGKMVPFPSQFDAADDQTTGEQTRAERDARIAAAAPVPQAPPAPPTTQYAPQTTQYAPAVSYAPTASYPSTVQYGAKYGPAEMPGPAEEEEEDEDQDSDSEEMVASSAPPRFETKAMLPHYNFEQQDASSFRGDPASFNPLAADPATRYVKAATRYFTPQEQRGFELNAEGGLLRNAAGALADTSGSQQIGKQGGGSHIFTMSNNGTIKAADAWGNHTEEKVGPGPQPLSGWGDPVGEQAADPHANDRKLSFVNHSSLAAEVDSRSVKDRAYAGRLAAGQVAGAGELTISEGRLERVTDRSGHYQPDNKMTANVLEQFGEMGVDLHHTAVSLESGDARPTMHASAREFDLIRGQLAAKGNDKPVVEELFDRRADLAGRLEAANQARADRAAAGTMRLGGQDVARADNLLDPRAAVTLPRNNVRDRGQRLDNALGALGQNVPRANNGLSAGGDVKGLRSMFESMNRPAPAPGRGSSQAMMNVFSGYAT